MAATGDGFSDIGGFLTRSTQIIGKSGNDAQGF